MIKYRSKFLLKELLCEIKHKETHSLIFPHAGSEFEVRNDIVSQFILKKLVPIVGINPFPLNELNLLTASVCVFRPSHIFEWGTNIGKSARIFFEICKYFGFDTEIHTIDLPDDVEHDEHPLRKRGYYVKGIKAVKKHQGDGVTTAIDLCASLENSIRPFFFLDGDHEYESVHRELRLIHKNVMSPAILVHDTFFQSEESGYNVGPHMAVKDFLKSFPGTYCRIEAHLGLPGMTFLYQK